MTHRINLEPAFVLHTRPFRDTSLIVNIFSLNHGRVNLLAKGARSPKSPFRALIIPFMPLLLSWTGKTDLPILTKAENSKLQYILNGQNLVHGLYLNELLINLLEQHNSYPNLFAIYEETLHALQQKEPVERFLRIFEKKLLKELGYGLDLDCVNEGFSVKESDFYHYEFGRGFSVLTPHNFLMKQNDSTLNNVYCGTSLVSLHEENLETKKALVDAERLLKSVLENLLGNKKIKSYRMFTDLDS